MLCYYNGPIPVSDMPEKIVNKMAREAPGSLLAIKKQKNILFFIFYNTLISRYFFEISKYN